MGAWVIRRTAATQGERSNMRKILISSAILLSLAGGASAMAATKPAAKPAQSAASATSDKAKACAAQWKAEKTHTQTRKAFMAACTKA